MDYLVLFYEYFKTRSKRSVFWTMVVPSAPVVILIFQDVPIYSKEIFAIHTTLQTIVGVLLGFSISTITMLLSIQSNGITEAKSKFMDEIKLYKKPVSLFDFLVIGLSYIIVLKSLILIYSIIFPLFVNLNSTIGDKFFIVEVWFVLYSMLIFMKSILDFYFTITSKK
jgi:hypothetical protein